MSPIGQEHPMWHVLKFVKGRHQRTGQPQWQARKMYGKKEVLFVPCDDSSLPTTNGETWVCFEEQTLFEHSNGNFKVMGVSLARKLFSSVATFRFELDPTRLLDGKPAWNSILEDATGHRIQRAVCCPDKFAKIRPDADHQFWVCSFNRELHVGRFGTFCIVSVNLLREDTAAKEKHLADLKVKEAQRLLDADTRRKADEAATAARALLLAELEQRRATREAYQEPVRRQRGPGGGCAAYAKPERRKQYA